MSDDERYYLEKYLAEKSKAKHTINRMLDCTDSILEMLKFSDNEELNNAIKEQIDILATHVAKYYGWIE